MASTTDVPMAADSNTLPSIKLDKNFGGWSLLVKTDNDLVWFMMFNATFNNISVIS
jgi:hypothetical protein